MKKINFLLALSFKKIWSRLLLLTEIVFLRFRQKQDQKVADVLCKASLQRRRLQSLVSLKFNLVQWIMETIVSIAIFLFESIYSGIFSIFIMSCGTPLIYYIAIEENRRKTIEFIQEKITRNDSPASTGAKKTWI